jgi:histidinol-phosphatase (PHP family)
VSGATGGPEPAGEGWSADATRTDGEGIDRDLPLDSHLHTRLSHDSEVGLDVYPALAAARGIGEIAITDHLDFDPRVPTSGVPPSERERLVRELAERWAERGVVVRYGAEITYERRFETEIREHLRRHRYDFTIGSVHVGPDSPYRADRVGAFVAGRSLAEILRPYFDEVLAAARSGCFDSLGHLDFVKRYLVPHVDPAAIAGALELVEPILRALVETGTGLEMNASGLHQAAREPYPGPGIVALYRDLGGRRVSVGSDAHRAEHFAVGLGRVYRLAAAAGQRTIHFRRGGEPVEIEIPEAVLEAVRRSTAAAGPRIVPGAGGSTA